MTRVGFGCDRGKTGRHSQHRMLPCSEFLGNDGVGIAPGSPPGYLRLVTGLRKDRVTLGRPNPFFGRMWMEKVENCTSDGSARFRIPAFAVRSHVLATGLLAHLGRLS
jgi:hypothetical protein